MSRKINYMKKELLAELADSSKKYTAQTLSQALSYDQADDFADLVKAIAQLEQVGEIAITSNGTLSLKQNKRYYTGVFTQNARGFGFVKTDELEKDIFIGKGKTNGALQNDEVKVKVTKEAHLANDKSAEGEIAEVLVRHTTRLTGEFTPFNDQDKVDTGFIGSVKPQNHGYDNLTALVKPDGLHPVEGEIVVVDLVDYPDDQHPFAVAGNVIQQIGHKDEPGVDILAILNMFEIPHEFSEEVLAHANEVPESISNNDLQGRKDHRDLLTITIDGADAKDLDDAISLSILPNGHYQLGVHIADVSYYVTEGSPMDKEAYERGTSVYLTDRVVPMLPQRLSNGICSLHPNVDRLTMSAIMEIDHNGGVINYDIHPSIIHSDYRMTYNDVNAIITDKDQALREKYSEITDMLENMASLHEILYNKRVSRGAIDFDSREAKILVDDEGHPTAIEVRERGVGEQMIESFMLSANETVAGHFTKKVLPFIYRVHEQPDEDRMQSFLEFVTAFGIVAKGTKSSIRPKDIQDILREVEGETFQPVVAMMLLRSMKQAHYDIEPIGHYGLAAEDYTHFTSPIRRYPDLIVHRLIHFYEDHARPNAEKQEKMKIKLSDIAEHSSKMERRSVDAERETDSLKKTEFMLDKIGMEFEGIISSVTGFGLFVELPNTVEGLVHISMLKDDYYNFVASHLVMIGERTGKTYRIGDKVTVKVIDVNTDTRDIDFIIVKSEDNVESSALLRQNTRKGGRGNNKGRKGNNRSRRRQQEKQKDGSPKRSEKSASDKPYKKKQKHTGKTGHKKKKSNKKNKKANQKRSFVIRQSKRK
ncbi:ribonuclease R [Aerococcus urinaeequi]|uniref:Ribonuclease R n=1 Tax=Aerococcus viridans TaxID=1377 RepID=A0A2N6UBL3_9LACT|nr:MULTISPECIES: ribonuclease R [Aerococcus]OFU53085.1 ribonuclease R [Aerococcus sp. HMSC10H05]PMC78929.1 ribonuclease R [Aerococcus viridans]